MSKNQYDNLIYDFITTVINSDYRNNSFGTQIYAMQYLLNKTKWLLKIAPQDNKRLVAQINNRLKNEVSNILNRPHTKKDISFENPYKKEKDNYLLLAYILILLKILSNSIKTNEMTYDMEKVFWYYFAVASWVLDLKIVPVDALFGMGKKILEPIYESRDKARKYQNARKKGAARTANNKRPIKEWALQEAHLLSSTNPHLSKSSLARIIKDKYLKRTWEKPLKQDGEHNTIYRWLLSDKSL